MGAPLTKAARQFLTDAKRAEARAETASPAHGEQLRLQARALRAAAARIQARARLEQGGELDLDG